LLVAHFADGNRALREAFAVTAMCAGDFVAEMQHAACARRRAFLTDRDVRRAAIIVITDWLVGAGAELDDHLLHFPDGEHVLEDRDRLGCRDRLRLEL